MNVIKTKRKKGATVSDTKRKAPTRKEIEVRAYEIYLHRGGENGTPLDDWLAAEKELSISSLTEVPDPTVPLPLQKRAANR
jgi:hypothetical protein